MNDANVQENLNICFSMIEGSILFSFVVVHRVPNSVLYRQAIFVNLQGYMESIEHVHIRYEGHFHFESAWLKEDGCDYVVKSKSNFGNHSMSFQSTSTTLELCASGLKSSSKLFVRDL